MIVSLLTIWGPAFERVHFKTSAPRSGARLEVRLQVELSNVYLELVPGPVR